MNPVKTKIEIVLETIAYYCRNPRAIGTGAREDFCEYLASDGSKCAFSRCCVDERVEEIKHSVGSVRTLGHPVDYYLRPEYQGHDVDFWRDVQWIHDSSTNWEEIAPGRKRLGVRGLDLVGSRWPEITLGQLLAAQS